MSSSDRESVPPGSALVIEDGVAEAAVKDADEAVGEGAQGPVVGVARGSALVVERTGAGAGGEVAKAHW